MRALLTPTIGLAAVLAGFATLALAGDEARKPAGDETRQPGGAETAVPYAMTVRMLRVDTNDAASPGLFSQTPLKLKGLELVVCTVEDGQLGRAIAGVGGVKLAGLEWAMLAEAAAEPRTGDPRYSSVAFYIDHAARPEQKEAIRKILAAPPFADLGPRIGIDEIPIEVLPGEKNFDEWKVKLGALGHFTLEPMGGSKGERIAVENPVYVFPAERLFLTKAFGEFKDHGKTLVLKGNSGQISDIAFKGTVPAGTVPAGLKKEPTETE
jgi:hypothetical protein